jgi:hypothetical protein
LLSQVVAHLLRIIQVVAVQVVIEHLLEHQVAVHPLKVLYHFL